SELASAKAGASSLTPKNNGPSINAWKQRTERTLPSASHLLPRNHAAMVCHSGSSFEDQCLPPGWKTTPPASAASGIVSRRLVSGFAGTTNGWQASKFRCDSASFQEVLPGESFCKRKAVPCE